MYIDAMSSKVANVLSEFSLEGRRALVTGAGRGIGRAIAVGLAQAGCELVLTARSADQLDSTRDEISPQMSGRTLAFNLSDSNAIPGFLDRAEQDGPLDIIVHSAGTQHREAAVTFPRSAWDQVIAVNLTAPFLLSQELGRRQLERGQSASHIFVASLTSVLGLPDLVAYNAAKSGLMGVVRALSREWSQYGIRVNGVSPGYVETSMTKDLFADPARRSKLLDRIPMGQFGTPDQLAGPTIFLASDAARYVTGQLLIVDGGWAAA